MASYNRVVLMGNLTRDVELRFTPNGKAVTDIGLAVNEKVKRGDEWTDVTTYVEVTLWGRTAEVAAEYLQKGSPAHVEGRLRLETWEQEGQKRSRMKVVADSLQLLPSGKSEAASSHEPVVATAG